ncbi:hypothetical protein LOC67_24675 [Stieleria sp. JC731]|uniref:hypothetical protein n=1 Tax=Pirellulaceae TaxID=2691357 RepID=UPI001E5940E8|nr:hypothetical protein [Stieleria sp. JC731]MCC9603758.1 hypothetical protein [Stieleria sp. JC731]
MKSVLEGFIGTYTSRYSDLRGYWLYGQLPFDTSEYHIDLLATPSDTDAPVAVAQRLATRRFEEQLAKSGVDAASIRSADLRIKMHSETVKGWQGDYRSDGHMVEFTAIAVMDNGRSYERHRTVFVAPHNPQKERRRLPDDWGI